MSKIRRLVLLVMLVWLLAVVIAWIFLSPPPPLVGGKTPPPALPPDGWRLERANLTHSLTVLASIPLWGVSRDGSPLPPPPKPVEEEVVKLIGWRFVATVERASERYALISVDDNPKLQVVREGEDLPNGGKLLRLDRQSASYQDKQGQQHTENLSF